MSTDCFWDKLESVKVQYADTNLHYFKRRSPWVRLGFRVLGTLLVGATVSGPLVLFFSDPRERELALAFVAFLVALLAGLNAFLQWHALWQKYVSMEVLIEHAIASWSIEMAAARVSNDRSAGTAVTHKLVDGIAAAMSAETVRFFQRLELPAGKPPNPT